MADDFFTKAAQSLASKAGMNMNQWGKTSVPSPITDQFMNGAVGLVDDIKASQAKENDKLATTLLAGGATDMALMAALAGAKKTALKSAMFGLGLMAPGSIVEDLVFPDTAGAIDDIAAMKNWKPKK